MPTDALRICQMEEDPDSSEIAVPKCHSKHEEPVYTVALEVPYLEDNLYTFPTVEFR